jgi:hypothetical protein
MSAATWQMSICERLKVWFTDLAQQHLEMTCEEQWFREACYIPKASIPDNEFKSSPLWTEYPCPLPIPPKMS